MSIGVCSWHYFLKKYHENVPTIVPKQFERLKGERHTCFVSGNLPSETIDIGVAESRILLVGHSPHQATRNKVTTQRKKHVGQQRMEVDRRVLRHWLQSTPRSSLHRINLSTLAAVRRNDSSVPYFFPNCPRNSLDDQRTINCRGSVATAAGQQSARMPRGPQGALRGGGRSGTLPHPDGGRHG